MRGGGMYIKNGIDFSIVKNLTESHEKICESIFIEIKHPNKRNVLIGTNFTSIATYVTKLL